MNTNRITPSASATQVGCDVYAGMSITQRARANKRAQWRTNVDNLNAQYNTLQGTLQGYEMTTMAHKREQSEGRRDDNNGTQTWTIRTQTRIVSVSHFTHPRKFTQV